MPPSLSCGLILEQIEHLFSLASEQFGKHPERSHRYVELARKLSMKHRVRLPSSLKRRFCHHCHRYLQSGKNCTVRIRDKKLVIRCFSCKHHTRISFK
ncbi:ribonuclease P [Candidatus Woesearchaeota archaeon]|nr:ribonuclease P [Candidatus Woesearchaeota archaeon]